MDIEKANAFCRSYGEAMAKEDPKAIAGHYGFPYVSFTSGYISTFTSREEADTQVSAHVARFDKQGLGTDIRLDDFRVEPVSGQSALCHLTWHIVPKDSTPGWSWYNVYGLRQTETGQYFEFNISDNEIGELLARFPDFMSL